MLSLLKSLNSRFNQIRSNVLDFRWIDGFGMSVVAKSDLKAGQPLVQIGRDGWFDLSADHAWSFWGENKPEVQERLIALVQSKGDLQPAQKALFAGSQSLVLYLAKRRKEMNESNIHLQVMPKKLNLPMLSGDVRSLQACLFPSPVIEQIVSQQILVEEVFQNVVVPSFSDMEFVGKEDFALAWALVLSRAINNTSSQIPFSIVPVLDMFNHVNEEDAQPGLCHHWFDHGQNCFFVAPHNDVKAGEQLFITYGKHANRNLLRLYGFCILDNPYDDVTIQVSENTQVTCNVSGEIFLKGKEDVAPSVLAGKLRDQLKHYNHGSNVSFAGVEPEMQRNIELLKQGEQKSIEICLTRLENQLV